MPKRTQEVEIEEDVKFGDDETEETSYNELDVTDEDEDLEDVQENDEGFWEGDEF